MREYREDEFLMLSGLQHYVFCKRQWALIHIEQQWVENFLTTDGNILHDKAHDGASFEKRKDTLISRGMPIHSYELGVSGTCDIVEFRKSSKGISIHGRDEKYEIYPVEYKRGSTKEDNSDRLQVVAQALCLEEMFCCTINKGYLFYGEMKRRVEVELNEGIREEAKKLIGEMHELFSKKHTPKVKVSKACKACSLESVCLPKITYQKNVTTYINRMLEE